MKNKNLIIFPDIKDNKKWKILGFILTILSLGIVFIGFYGIFFERQDYYNRKYLYEYLKDIQLPIPFERSFKNHFIFDMGDFELVYSSDKLVYVCAKNDKDVKLCSWHGGGIFDKSRYKKIKQMLEEKIKEQYGKI